MALTNAERQARYRGAAEGLEAVELPRASGVTARPPATASGGRPRRGAGRRHREAVDAGGVVLPGSDPPPGRTASLSEGRRRVAAGRPHCTRPPQRCGPSRDTPPAPRLGGQSGALRPGLDARVPTVHNVPGTRRATELRTPPPDRNRRSRCRGTPPFGRRADGGVGLVRRGGRRNHGTGDRPRATDASRPSTGRADRRSLTRTAALGWSRRRRATADPRRAPRAPNSSARAGLTCWPETGRPRPRPWQIMSVQRAPAHRSPRQDPCFRPLIRPPSPRLTCRRFRLISGLERTTVLPARSLRRRTVQTPGRLVGRRLPGLVAPPPKCGSFERETPGPAFVSGQRWLIRLAMAAAPKPLSMLTTATPVAQLFNIDSSAATPPAPAP